MHPLQAIDCVLYKLYTELANRNADGSGQVENLCILLLNAAQQKVETMKLFSNKGWKIKYESRNDLL